MANPNYEDRSFGEVQKYGTIEAPSLPELPTLHEDKLERAQEGHQGIQAEVEAVEKLRGLLNEQDLREAWSLNFYLPGKTAPADIAEAIYGLYPGFEQRIWDWGRFQGKVAAVIRMVERYLQVYRMNEEQIVGQELAELAVSNQGRIKSLEDRLTALES